MATTVLRPKVVDFELIRWYHLTLLLLLQNGGMMATTVLRTKVLDFELIRWYHLTLLLLLQNARLPRYNTIANGNTN